MKKLKLLQVFIFCPFFIFSQVQIGQDINGEHWQDQSGSSVSLSSNGNVVAIGSTLNDDSAGNAGHVRVYENQSGSWIQIGQDIDGEAGSDASGTSVSLSADGSVVAIGAPRNDDNGIDSGHVRVYEYQSTSWVQIGSDIDGEGASNLSGNSVSLSSDGNLMAIGAVFNSDNGVLAGQVRIYENQSGNWIQLGDDINGEEAGDGFGRQVSLSSDGSVVAIGAPSGSGITGYVRVYEYQSGSWIQIGSDIDGEAEINNSGYSVSLSSDGSVVAIGAPDNNGNGEYSGQVRVYENQSGSWVQIGSDIDGEAAGDYSGHSVSLSSNGNVVAIGAYSNDGNEKDSGHVRVYENQSGNWVQIGRDIDGEAYGDRSGTSISLSSDGRILAIGADRNAGNLPGSIPGHVRVYDISTLLSLNEQNLSFFNLYPNPTKTQFTIQLKDGIKLEKVNIYNNLGQLVLTSKENIINSSKFSVGLYIVEIQTNKGKGSKKLIVE